MEEKTLCKTYIIKFLKINLINKILLTLIILQLDVIRYPKRCNPIINDRLWLKN